MILNIPERSLEKFFARIPVEINEGILGGVFKGISKEILEGQREKSSKESQENSMKIYKDIGKIIRKQSYMESWENLESNL